MKRQIKIIISLVVVGLIAIYFYNTQIKVRFNSDIYNGDNIVNHIEELTEAKYEGRLAGSKGNELSLAYITEHFRAYNIQPGGEDGTYFQSFDTVIPEIDTNPIFTINSQEQSSQKSFEIYNDYSVLTSFYGGSTDFDGEMILVGSNILRIPKSEIKDRIVVIVSARLNPERVQYVIDNGGKGILCSADTESFSRTRAYEKNKYIGLESKQGNEILMGYVSKEMYREMLNLVDEESKDTKYIEGIISSARIKVDVKYPVVETSNVLGLIEGKSDNNRTLLISSNIDGLGYGSDGKIFQGAMKSTAGIATILEIARVLQGQDDLPYENIVLVGFNGQEQQYSGSNYYLENPLYPLDKTTILHINHLGGKSLEGLVVSSDIINASILSDNFSNYAKDVGINITRSGQSYSGVSGFADQLVPSLVLSNDSKNLSTYEDTNDKIDFDTLDVSAQAILLYIQREYYKDYRIDFLQTSELIIIFCLLVMIVLNIIINQLYKRHPNQNFLGIKIENIYYNYIVSLNRRFIKHILPYIIILFLIIMLANISPNTNIKFLNNQWVTNFSPYLLFKNSIYYLRDLLNLSIHSEYKVGNIFEVIYDSSIKSIKLIGATLILATILGIIKGVIDGVRSQKSKLNSFGTIVVFSLPDVLIVLVGLLVYVFLVRQFPSMNSLVDLNKFVLPVITLMVLPSIYISRITFITTQNELDKDYIKHSKAIGMSRTRIFITELLPSIAFTLVDTMPTIMAMILSNMIIVEYMFNYNGIIYYLLYLYKRQDIYRFVPLAITLGIIYLLFTYGTYWIAKIINPLKREVKS